MYTFVVVVHIIVCALLVLTVLLQQGKGAEIGAVFGSSEAVFGGAGPATFLNKVTTVLAVIFMVTSLGLTYLAAHRTGGSVMQGVEVSVPAPKAVPGQEKVGGSGVSGPAATNEKKAAADDVSQKPHSSSSGTGQAGSARSAPGDASGGASVPE